MNELIFWQNGSASNENACGKRLCASAMDAGTATHLNMKMYVGRLCASAMDEGTATHLGKMFVFAK